METIISPISIDFGAKNTGVWSPEYIEVNNKNIEIRGNYGASIYIDQNNIQFSQADRRVKRHQMRGYKRRKMAKRLLRVILKQEFKVDIYKLNYKIRDFILGLMNRRGYTFFSSDELDEEKISAIPDNWYIEKIEMFENSTLSVLEQFEKISGDMEQIGKLEHEIKGLLDNDNYQKRLPENTKPSTCKNALIKFNNAIKTIKRSENDGHRHRSEYLKNIKQEIDANQKLLSDLFDKSAIDARTLYQLIGHISNLQLRVLRKYFNDTGMKMGDKWLPDKMGKCFYRYIKSWNTSDKDEKDRKQKVLKELKRTNSILELWSNIEPESTIPPFENQNNRKPPKCMSLIIDKEKIDNKYEHWRDIVNLLSEIYETGDNISLERKLQRILDCSVKHDEFSIRRLSEKEDYDERFNKLLDEKQERLKQLLGKKYKNQFLSIAKNYYEECDKAARGDWHPEYTDGILKRCGKNPPHKKKQKHLFLSSLFNYKFKDGNDIIEFKNMLSTEKVSRTTIKGIALKAAKKQKEHGNILKKIIERGEDKDINELVDQIHKASLKIDIFFKERLDKNSAIPEISKYDNMFTFIQMYNVLFENLDGFSSTCNECTKDNAWRMQIKERYDKEKYARAKRLPADSVRPFDGVVARIIDKISTEIAEIKYSQLKNLDNIKNVYIPLVVESNSFEFTSELYDLKNVSKKKKDKSIKDMYENIDYTETYIAEKSDRIKRDSKDICPYCGEIIRENGEIDHVVPRAYTRKHFKTIFNSEPNLIYCCKGCNNRKGDSIYTINDLSNKYLQNIFGETDRNEIRRRVENVLEKNKRERANLSSFNRFSEEDRHLVRHALFIEPIRDKVLNVLNTQTKTKVNGTQKYLVRKIGEKIRKKVNQGMPEKTCLIESERIKAETTHEYRRALAEKDPESESKYKKSKEQSSISHVIDAVSTFAAYLDKKGGFKIKNSELGSVDTDIIEGMCPEKISIRRIQRKPRYLKEKPWEQSIFKDTMYGVHFVPFFITSEGQPGLGFSAKNFIPFDMKKPNKIENTFQMLKPFLMIKVNGKYQSVEKSLIEFCDEAKKYKKCYSIVLSKNGALDFLYNIAKHDYTPEEDRIGAILEEMMFITIKKKLPEFIMDNNRKLLSKDKINKNINCHISIKMKKDLKCEGSLIYPGKADWVGLLNLDILNNVIGYGNKIGNSEIANLNNEIKDYIVNRQNNRSYSYHKKARKVYSLPIVDSSATLCLLKRKVPKEDHIWQAINVEGAYEGFQIKKKKFTHAALQMQEQLKNSKNLFMIGQRYKTDSKVCYMNEWRELDIPEKIRDKLCNLYVMPGQASRNYVRISMCFNKFRDNVLKNIGIDTESIISYYDLSHEIKCDYTKDGKDNLKKYFNGLLNIPRNKITVEEIGDIVTFIYEANGKVSPEIIKSYFESIAKP